MNVILCAIFIMHIMKCYIYVCIRVYIQANVQLHCRGSTTVLLLKVQFTHCQFFLVGVGSVSLNKQNSQ